MMNKTVQHGCTQDAIPDFDVIRELIEEDTEGTIHEQEITKIRELHSRPDKPDPELRQRTVQGPFGRRWSRHMNPTETYRAPSLFTWRC